MATNPTPVTAIHPPARKTQKNSTTVVQCRVDLPEHIYELYASQAARQNKDPELVMLERLTRCVSQAEEGLWFSPPEKKRLEACIGHMCSTADGVLQRLEPLSRITVEGMVLPIDPVVLKRLSTRVLRGQSLQDLISKTVTKSLRQFVGFEPY